MKKVFVIGLVLFSAFVNAQRFRRSDGTPIVKPVSVSNIPAGMGYYYDTLLYKWRPFQSTAEVLTFYPNLPDRQGNFTVYVKTGGTLSNGVITGGLLSKWWFKNGTADSNLVNQDDYAGLINKPIIPAQINLIAGSGVTITGSYPNYTVNSTGGGSSYAPPTTQNITSTGSALLTLSYAYVSGSVTVYENGMLQANSFTETSSTTITLNYTPFVGTTFTVNYTKQ